MLQLMMANAVGEGISQRGKQKAPFFLVGSGEVRLQSSASVVASLPFLSADSLANTSGDSQLGARVPLIPSLFFITGLAVERLPTRSPSQILLEPQLSHGAFIPNNSAAMLASAVRSCLNFLLPQ